MLGSPQLLMSHSSGGFPGLQFSAMILFAGEAQGFGFVGFAGCAAGVLRDWASSRAPAGVGATLAMYRNTIPAGNISSRRAILSITVSFPQARAIPTANVRISAASGCRHAI